jgi:acyl carrier protein
MNTYDTLTLELKHLIVDSCEKQVDPASILDDELLFGPNTRLALDSLDALQVSMAIQKRYGLRLTDSKETRRLLSCVGNLATHLATRNAS